jgi:hypothetical protein
MDNEKMIAEFYAKAKELYALGRNIVNHYNDNEDREYIFDAIEEIWCISLDCLKGIEHLETEMGYKK